MNEPGATSASLCVAGDTVVEGDPTGAPDFVYLDCGAWMGDGRNTAAQRSFGVASGSLVALCEFQPGRPLAEIPDESRAAATINRLLRALAGPQRMDVSIRRWLRTPYASQGDDALTVFLPDMHLPLVAPMPELVRGLIPDPAQITCWCHGPIFARIDGTAPVTTTYRAVGTYLSREPNDWFEILASSYRAPADDLLRFLDRLARVASVCPHHIVHLGGLFEVWAGYRCMFQARGIAAMLLPRIVADADITSFLAYWSNVTIDTRMRQAVRRLLQLPVAQRTVLSAPHTHALPDFGLPEPPAGDGPRRYRTPAYLAENRPEPVEGCNDRPPHAVLGLIEQCAQLVPWRRDQSPGWRARYVAHVAQRWRAERFPLHVMAHTHVATLTSVHVQAPT